MVKEVIADELNEALRVTPAIWSSMIIQICTNTLSQLTRDAPKKSREFFSVRKIEIVRRQNRSKR